MERISRAGSRSREESGAGLENFLRIDKEQRYSYSVNISKKGGATMKKIAFVLACILTISICLAGCQETEFDTGEGTPVFSLDANEISAVTFQNGNTGEKTIVSNRDEITEIADYLNAFRYTETQSVRGGDGWSSRIIIDFNEGESISFYSLEAGKIIMDDTEYILTSSEEGKVFDLEYNDEEPNTAPTGETEDIEEDPSLVTNNEGQLISEFLDLDHTYSEDDVHKIWIAAKNT